VDFVDTLYFSLLLNILVHRFTDVWQREIQKARPLVPDPSPFEVEIAIAKLKRHKSPDPTPKEIIHAGGEILGSLSLVSTNEDLLGRKSSGSSLDS
jgi:hypothetical protein